MFGIRDRLRDYFDELCLGILKTVNETSENRINEITAFRKEAEKEITNEPSVVQTIATDSREPKPESDKRV